MTSLRPPRDRYAFCLVGAVGTRPVLADRHPRRDAVRDRRTVRWSSGPAGPQAPAGRRSWCC